MNASRTSFSRLIRMAATAGVLIVCGCNLHGTRVPTEAGEVGRSPNISPDYRDCTVPPNIAPLNFIIKESGTGYRVLVHSEKGEGFVVSSRSPRIIMPQGRWASLLELNRGKPLLFDVYARNKDGSWRRFNPVTNTIAPEDIDPYLSYRRIKPVHTIYTRMGTYERDVRSYRESPVLLSDPDSRRCVNCHSFVAGDPDRMCLQVRSQTDGASMILLEGGSARKINTRNEFNTSPASYTSWHPGGRLAAFAAIKVIQFHHSTGNSRDVLDIASDVCIYFADTNKVTSNPALSDPCRLETFPTWSPDGKYLYFSSAHKPWPHDTKKGEGVPMSYRTVRYDLMRISYDAATGEWGELETVLASKGTGLSISEPRVSPDGRFLLCCMSEYGCFPVFQESSDLYIVDLGTGEYRALDVNSDQSDSWHCWSTNNRWIAFASKRGNGLFGRIYFSYIDHNGMAHKPLVLPQRDPGFYDASLDSFNRPELAAKPIEIEQKDLLEVLAAADREDTVYVGTVARVVTPHRKDSDEQPIKFPRRVTQDSQRRAFQFFQSGLASEKEGRTDEAVEQYGLAIRALPALHPLNIPALKNLAWIYATHPSDQVRSSGQALRLAGYARKSVVLQSNRAPDERVRQTAKSTMPSVTDTLAAAFAEAGRFDEAIRTALEAETLALDQGQLELAVAIRARLNQYLVGKPHRTAWSTEAVPVRR